MTLKDLISEAVDRPLTAEEAEEAFNVVMKGEATPVQIAALLVAIRARGATAQEVAGGVRALRTSMVPIDVPDTVGMIDTCGTGGGTVTTFNISTASALLVSGLGVPVAKHGNRSFTSKCGSADVLEKLGVQLDNSPERKSEILREIGIVFLFAPAHHPAMRHVVPVRKELGIFTIMNLLGPLTNPAGVRRQVIGVVDPSLIDLVADALAALGHEHAMVVHGEPGLDELSPLGVTDIAEITGTGVRRYQFDPRVELGWPEMDPGDLAGGDVARNAAMIEEILRGQRQGAARAAVLLNSAAALTVAGRVSGIVEGVREAEKGLDSGIGWEQLERLRKATAAT